MCSVNGCAVTTAENGPRALEFLGLGDHRHNALEGNVSKKPNCFDLGKYFLKKRGKKTYLKMFGNKAFVLRFFRILKITLYVFYM